MQCTRRLLAPPGFWKRSLQELSRLSSIGPPPSSHSIPTLPIQQLTWSQQTAIKAEAINRPDKPFPLITFDQPDSHELCKVMSDEDMGGFSNVHFDFVPAHAQDPPHIRFHGTISNELPADKPQIQRSGYAAWRTRDMGRNLFGKGLWDLDSYRYIALKVKSDARKYFVNVQTESIVPTDLHQHRLYAQKPGDWETVIVPISEFVRTNHGMVVEPQSDMMRQKVRSIGIGLIDRVPGPFDLCIADIYATNNSGGKDFNKKPAVDDQDLEGDGLLLKR
jgi:NADH dehydrogenase [ubiquinone] 1 alpha subcomplex assembly factor 1